jgi:hypothetical protein
MAMAGPDRGRCATPGERREHVDHGFAPQFCYERRTILPSISCRDPSRSSFKISDPIKAYLTLGALTREIGAKIKALVQKGSFGAEFRCKGFAPGHLTPFARTDATPRMLS